jgi:hypothetical protein
MPHAAASLMDRSREEIMRRANLLVALALVAAPVLAHAQADLSTAPGSTVVATLTPVQVVGLLQAQGFTATAGGLDTDVPWVDSSTSEGLNYSINFYGCVGAKVKQCNHLQFRARFTRKAEGNDALMTQYDRAWVFGKAYVNPEGDMVIEHAINTEGGVTLDNLAANLQLWHDMLGDFTKEINW